MAFSEKDLTTIDQAIASGALSVRYTDGRQITYRSLPELREARRLVSDALAQAAGRPATRQVRVWTRSGF